MSIIDPSAEDPKLIDCLIEFCYREKYTNSPPDGVVNPEWPLILHIEMYALADPFDVKALAECAAEEVAWTLSAPPRTFFVESQFIDTIILLLAIIPKVYGSTT